MKRFTFSKKPKKCPVCGSTRVAPIMYGLPAPNPELWRKVEEGRLVLGGCRITGDDPSWKCVEGEATFYRRDSATGGNE